MSHKSNPWWMVDLTRVGVVTGIKLNLKTDMSGTDQAILLVTVSNPNFSDQECVTFRLNESISDVHAMTYCERPICGRSVRLSMIAAQDLGGDGSAASNCSFTMDLREIEVILGKKLKLKR